MSWLPSFWKWIFMDTFSSHFELEWSSLSCVCLGTLNLYFKSFFQVIVQNICSGLQTHPTEKPEQIFGHPNTSSP